MYYIESKWYDILGVTLHFINRYMCAFTSAQFQLVMLHLIKFIASIIKPHEFAHTVKKPNTPQI